MAVPPSMTFTVPGFRLRVSGVRKIQRTACEKPFGREPFGRELRVERIRIERLTGERLSRVEHRKQMTARDELHPA
jgi:hypothetical protein